MRYFLIEPSEAGETGIIRKIFESLEDAELWLEENKDNNEYLGCEIYPETEIGKLN